MFLTGKESIKSYLVFTSFWYRVAVYAILPLGITALAVWGGVCIGDIGLLLMALVLPGMEVISDSWLFGGIQARDMEKIDYIKSSGRGMSVMERALWGDLARKLFTAAGTILVSGLAIGIARKILPPGPGLAEAGWTDFISRGGSLRQTGILLYLVLLLYFLSVLGTFLSRFGNSIYWNMLSGYGAVILGAVGLFAPGLAFYRSAFLYVMDLLWAVLGAGISVLAIRIAMKKVKGGYYDQ